MDLPNPKGTIEHECGMRMLDEMPKFGQLPPVEFTCTIKAGKKQKELLRALRGKKLKLPRKMKKGAKPLFRITRDYILLKLDVTDDDLKFRTQWRRKATWWLYLKLRP